MPDSRSIRQFTSPGLAAAAAAAAAGRAAAWDASTDLTVLTPIASRHVRISVGLRRQAARAIM